MNRLRLVFLAIPLVASGCATSREPAKIANSNDLTPMQLIATIDTHKGQTVTVVGYFVSVVDTRALWENEAAHQDAKRLRKGSWDKCITIYLSSGVARQFSGHRVRITGKATTIGNDDIRSFWTCNPVALEDADIALD
jgi:hypothetical protein